MCLDGKCWCKVELTTRSKCFAAAGFSSNITEATGDENEDPFGFTVPRVSAITRVDCMQYILHILYILCIWAWSCYETLMNIRLNIGIYKRIQFYLQQLKVKARNKLALTFNSLLASWDKIVFSRQSNKDITSCSLLDLKIPVKLNVLPLFKDTSSGSRPTMYSAGVTQKASDLEI